MEKCKKCDSKSIVMIQYGLLDPNHYDGVSEYRCKDCGYREGRWTGKELMECEQEKPYGGNNI